MENVGRNDMRYRIQNEKEKAMKNTLTRILAIMTLATSISAFALSEKPCAAKDTGPNNASSETITAPSTRDAGKADQDQEPSDNSQEKSRKHLIEQQNKQWLHDVQNIVAG